MSQVLLAAFQLRVCSRGGDLLEALQLLEVTALAGDCLELVNARTRATRLEKHKKTKTKPNMQQNTSEQNREEEAEKNKTK